MALQVDPRRVRPVPHALEHELAGGDTVRPSVQNSGTQLNRQRTLNFEDGLDAAESSTNKRIDVGLVAGGHGADKHADITRSLWLPAERWTIITGTPAIVIVGTRYRVWAFDPTSDEEITTDALLPADWTSGALVFKQLWTNIGAAGAGNVVWRLDVAATADAEGLAAGWVTTRDTIAAPALSVLKWSTLTATVTPSASDLIQLLVGRDADNAADTVNGNDVGFLGLVVEYTANQ